MEDKEEHDKRNFKMLKSERQSITKMKYQENRPRGNSPFNVKVY